MSFFWSVLVLRAMHDGGYASAENNSPGETWRKAVPRAPLAASSCTRMPRWGSSQSSRIFQEELWARGAHPGHGSLIDESCDRLLVHG
mmetsp:Transcript_63855/g.132027  ORF Transcript_63855/g.132027 Transcript_63855/m.132027 type:complete len:88 (+) Transcript_63855:200-463(+)